MSHAVVAQSLAEARIACKTRSRKFRALDALVGGNDEQRRNWMTAYNRALNGVPRDLVTTAQGLVRTVAYLDSMRAPM